MTVTADLNFTKACAQKVWSLIEKEQDNSGLNLRVYIQGADVLDFSMASCLTRIFERMIMSLRG